MNAPANHHCARSHIATALIEQSNGVSNCAFFIALASMATCAQVAPVTASDHASQKLLGTAQQTVQFTGRANSHKDCQRLVQLLYASRAAPFVHETFWYSDDEYFPDVLVYLEFRCKPQDLSRMCWAVESLLQDLCDVPELNVLTDTLTFTEEYSGQRLHDRGNQHRANFALRFYSNVKSVA